MISSESIFSCRLESEDSFIICNDFSKYKDYEKEIIEIYLDLYKKQPLLYGIIPVRMKHYPPEYGEMSGFNHLMYENYDHTDNETDRKPNLKRMEMVKWPKELIEYCHSGCPDLLVWENVRHGKENIILYCDPYDYAVILGKRNGYLLLTTAYPVETDARREKMLKEYDAYMQTSHSG